MQCNFLKCSVILGISESLKKCVATDVQFYSSCANIIANKQDEYENLLRKITVYVRSLQNGGLVFIDD